MIVFCEKTPAVQWWTINRRWDFWWFGVAFGQVFFGVMVRTRKGSKISL